MQWILKKCAVSFLFTMLLISILIPIYFILINVDMKKLLPLAKTGHDINISMGPPLVCSPNMSLTCPANYSVLIYESSGPKSQSCPDYFRWIHEDLRPWKEKGITREMLERAKNVADFRLIIVKGKAYVEKYRQPYQTRDVFTLWGILQLMKLYPGKLPDLDLFFQCGDITVIQKKDYQFGKGSSSNSSLFPPPVFHYCGDDSSFDIAFPDWSFWGWIETSIKPWDSLVKDLKKGNSKVKWVKRKPYAHWRGNIYNGHRDDLAKCNSTEKWNAQIYNLNWELEAKKGFRNTDLAGKCRHKYKIYMEGNAWSVSRKYIMACDSMNLVVNPRYYDFFSRSLVPRKHYWPIDPNRICESINFAVNWGRKHQKEAKAIGRGGSKFIQEELKMRHVYDYMYHLLNEYAKLLTFKPSIPPMAVQLCSTRDMVCASQNGSLEEKYKVETMVKSSTVVPPCTMKIKQGN